MRENVEQSVGSCAAEKGSAGIRDSYSNDPWTIAPWFRLANVDQDPSPLIPVLDLNPDRGPGSYSITSSFNETELRT